MKSLTETISDVDVLLAMEPEELGWELLLLARENDQLGSFHPGFFFQSTSGGPSYPSQRRNEIDIAVGEALAWLTINILIMPAPDVNGDTGHRVLTRRGRAITDSTRFTRFREAAAFPKTLIHPLIADKVWLALARGDLDDAVFISFKAVEVAVRDAAELDDSDVGVKLMRKAFHMDTGSLTDQSQEAGEREALSFLFSGAIGSYKNPHSHRTVTINDPREAQEMVMLASHLLRIVDARRAKRVAAVKV